VSDAVRWLTYDEIAAEWDIERESARQLAIRKRWARQRGNDNKARVGVPEEEFEARTADATPQSPSDATADQPSHDTGADPSVIQVLTRHISRLEAELDTLKEERKAERERLEGRAEALESKISTLEQELTAERLISSQVGTLKSVIDDLKTERDRWANAAEASQQRLDRAIEAAKTEPRRGWWPFRRSA
jgi:predicted RNase H-like nuclease (RuvC/YqgF family)